MAGGEAESLVTAASSDIASVTSPADRHGKIVFYGRNPKYWGISLTLYRFLHRKSYTVCPANAPGAPRYISRPSVTTVPTGTTQKNVLCISIIVECFYYPDFP